MHTKQHRTSFPTLHRASTSPPVQSYHLPEHRACNRTQSFSPAGTQCLTSTIHNTQSLCYLPGCFRPQSPTPQAKLCASSPPCTELLLPGTQSYRTPHTELHISPQPLSHNSPGKALCFFSSVHRDSASRNTELLPRGNTVLNLHQTQYTELMLSSGMLPPTKPHTPGKALCFFIPFSQNYHLTELSPSGTQSFNELVIEHRASIIFLEIF